MALLKWRKVGREYHSTDGRFEIYCSGVSRSYYGSYGSWVVIDRDGPATSVMSLPKAKAAAQRRMEKTS